MKSLVEALHHGGIANRVEVNLEWIESEVFERKIRRRISKRFMGTLVPGGFN